MRSLSINIDVALSRYLIGFSVFLPVYPLNTEAIRRVVSCYARGGLVCFTNSKVDIRCDTTSGVPYYTLTVTSRL